MPFDAAVSQRPTRAPLVDFGFLFTHREKPITLAALPPELAICDRLAQYFSKPANWLKGKSCEGPETLGFHSFAGRHDLHGALNLLDHGTVVTLGLGDEHMHNPVVANVFRELRAVIRRRTGDPTIGLVRFNDRVSTRHIDIMSVLAETRTRFKNGKAVSAP